MDPFRNHARRLRSAGSWWVGQARRAALMPDRMEDGYDLLTRPGCEKQMNAIRFVAQHALNGKTYAGLTLHEYRAAIARGVARGWIKYPPGVKAPAIPL